MRAILAGGCVWSAIALASIVGLFLKHFLQVGERLRRQFLMALGLFAVTGLAFLADLWNMFVTHGSFPGESWSLGQLQDWLTFFLYYPHHLMAAVCCLFAFLLAWIAAREQTHRAASVVLIAAALASAFGLSVYVAFAFFLVVILWALWQLSVERQLRAPLRLAAGGVAALVLLIPYLRSLAHSDSKMEGGSIFVLWVRETSRPICFSARLPSVTSGSRIRKLPMPLQSSFCSSQAMPLSWASMASCCSSFLSLHGGAGLASPRPSGRLSSLP